MQQNCHGGHLWGGRGVRKWGGILLTFYIPTPSFLHLGPLTCRAYHSLSWDLCCALQDIYLRLLSLPTRRQQHLSPSLGPQKCL